MIKNKFLALAMAAAMTLATAVPAFASSGTTTVSLTVAPKNTYTLTVPSATTLDNTGEATQLTGGIKITNGDLEEGKKLTVTASSDNEWRMKASSVTTEIGYSLYSDAGITETETWEFKKDEANKTGGTTKDVYAKANATDLAAAASGTYSDVITFTAEVKDAKVSFWITKDNEGGYFEVDPGTTWGTFLDGAGNHYNECMIAGTSGNTVSYKDVIVAGEYIATSRT